MAISAMIPELWRAAYETKFKRTNSFSQFATDLSAELPEGDTLHLGFLESTGTLKNYTRNTDIADPEIATDSEVILTLDQEKYFNIFVDDVDKVQSKPDIMTRYLQNTLDSSSDALDDYLRSVYEASFPSSQDTEAKPISEASDVATTTAFITKMNGTLRELQDRNWPVERTFAAFSSAAAAGVRQFMIHSGKVPGLGERAITSGDLSNLFGIRTMIDGNMAKGTADGTPMVNFGLTDSLYYAVQVRKIEAYRPDKRFGDAVKGLFVYGALRPDAEKVYRIKAKS